jgi:hypothetical protein
MTRRSMDRSLTGWRTRREQHWPCGSTGEQTVVADAVEPARQDVEQEPADELGGGERHHLMPPGPERR